MAETIDQPLKPARRAFLKAMGVMTGAAVLPSAVMAGLQAVPATVLPPVLPPLPDIEALLTPVSGIRDLSVFINGVMQTEGLDFVQVGNGTVELLGPPRFGDIVIGYQTLGGVRRHLDGETVIDLQRS